MEGLRFRVAGFRGLGFCGFRMLGLGLRISHLRLRIPMFKV